MANSSITVYKRGRMLHDGVYGWGRRISKEITNCNNWNCSYHYYLDGDSIKVRNGSDMVIKQQMWGVGYIDELVQQGINSTPTTQSTLGDGMTSYRRIIKCACLLLGLA